MPADYNVKKLYPTVMPDLSGPSVAAKVSIQSWRSGGCFDFFALRLISSSKGRRLQILCEPWIEKLQTAWGANG